MRTRDTVIVVPCYNEAQRLDAAALCDLVRVGGIGLVLVDDGSTDGTGTILDALACSEPDIEVVHLPANVGKGEAVRQGLRRALASGAAIVGYYDADLATPPAELLGLLDVLDADPEAVAAIGSRNHPAATSDRHRHRRALSQCFAGLAGAALGVPVRDTQCGAKVLRATPALRQAVGRPFGGAWSFDVTLLDRVFAAAQGKGSPHDGGHVLEVPLRGWSDVAGSKLRAVSMVRAGAQVVLLGMRRGWRRRPDGALRAATAPVTVIDLRAAPDTLAV